MTADSLIRNQMSVMAWGMAALCAWVVIVSVHTFDGRLNCPQYSTSTDADTAKFPTVAAPPQ